MATYASQTDSSLPAIRPRRYQPDSVIAPHAHAVCSLTFVLAGSYVETIGRRDIEGRAGSLLIYPSGVEHRQHFGRNGASKIIVTPDDRLLDYLRSVASLAEAPCTRSTEIMRIGRQLEAELRHPDDFSLAVTDGLLWQAAGLLGRNLAGSAMPMQALVRQACRVLEAADGLAVKISALSRMLNCHPATLTRAFRRELNCTPAEHQRRLRIEQACRLLRRSTVPLSEVAAECGFCDQAHLSRAFQRQLGCTPGQFRRRS